MSRYEQWLWSITKFYLEGYAQFDHSEDSFKLKHNPFPNEQIHEGPYRLLRSQADRKKSEIEVEDDTNIYRVGHPLAQRIINACKNEKLDTSEINFNYSGTGKKITVLESLVGLSGWLQASLLTISSFEIEEYIVLSCFTDDGKEIDAELCQKFFSLFATVGENAKVSNELKVKFSGLDKKQVVGIVKDNMDRNAQFFDDELDKLENWADDMKLSLEKEIKDLDAEIKLKKTETRKITDLKKKVALQRGIKGLEKKRNEKRKHLFVAQDQIDEKKDNLLSEIESRLKQQVEKEVLFTIKWNLN